MPQRTLRFRIREDGLVEESVEGVMGQSCHEVTKRVEEALGTVLSHQPTGEAFLEPLDQNQIIPAKIF